MTEKISPLPLGPADDRDARPADLTGADLPEGQQTQESAAAIPLLERAIGQEPRNPGLHSNLGIAWRGLGRLERALACFRRAEELDPCNPTWALHTANALIENGAVDEGISRLEQLLVSDPGNAEARWQRVYGLLLQGRYREAWPQFSWRWRVAGFPSPRLPTLQPAWDGVTPCRRLLLWREQGIGDELMFLGLMGEARRWLAERRIAPVLLVDGRLVAPLRRSWPDLTIEAWGTPLPALDCDQHLPIGELCGLLAPAAAGPPRIVEPWLQADPSRLAQLHARLPRPAPLRCGIAWRSAAAVLGACKSLPLASLARALQLEGVQLVNLQYGTRAGELAELAQRSGLRVEEVPGLDLHDDLDGLAALIAGCDLVVTASNCTAHLSSAVGTPTWVLLHRVPHWPWGLKDHTTPWHPGTRLFRQDRSGDWEFPLKQVNLALQQQLQKAA